MLEVEVEVECQILLEATIDIDVDDVDEDEIDDDTLHHKQVGIIEIMQHITDDEVEVLVIELFLVAETDINE